MAEISPMGGEHHGSGDPGNGFAPRPGRRVRIVREPLFSVGDVVAGVVILVMVCGPLALGALGY